MCVQCEQTLRDEKPIIQRLSSASVRLREKGAPYPIIFSISHIITFCNRMLWLLFVRLPEKRLLKLVFVYSSGFVLMKMRSFMML